MMVMGSQCGAAGPLPAGSGLAGDPPQWRVLAGEALRGCVPPGTREEFRRPAAEGAEVRVQKPPRRVGFPLGKAMAPEGCDRSWRIRAPRRRAAPARDGRVYTLHALSMRFPNAAGTRRRHAQASGFVCVTSLPFACNESRAERG